jgi:cupin 2 domain-containing protein
VTCIVRNLFSNLPSLERGEDFLELLRHRNLRIERILSSAQPNDTAWDQAQDEWVILLEGSATLDIDGQVVHLGRGDHVFLPARTPHRVLSTDPQPRCLWLAVHLFPSGHGIGKAGEGSTSQESAEEPE